jgi:hypothetical protein
MKSAWRPSKSSAARRNERAPFPGPRVLKYITKKQRKKYLGSLKKTYTFKTSTGINNIKKYKDCQQGKTENPQKIAGNSLKHVNRVFPMV